MSSILFNLVALTVIVYTGVDVFYRIVRLQLKQIRTEEIVLPKAPEVQKEAKMDLREYQVIMDRNLFGSKDKAKDQEEEEAVVQEDLEAIEPTTLKVALLGTVAGDRRNAFAVIEETDKRKQGLFKVGDSVKGAMVKSILRGRVILRVGDKDEMLAMKEPSSSKGGGSKGGGSAPGSNVAASTITISRAQIQDSLQNINRLLTEARVRPHYSNGRPDGLSISRIRPGSLFQKLGLNNGDVIQGINNRQIKGPDDIMSFYQKLKIGSGVSLDINRRGQMEKINYRFQ